MNRRFFLGLAAAGLAGSSALMLGGNAALAKSVDVSSVLRDPEAPVGGNPRGDVTIVAFFDYNCPYCKLSAVDLARVVKEDGRIRLVYKDWAILSAASVQGAQYALAAKYQGKYVAAHNALMRLSGGHRSGAEMLQAIKASGVDVNRLQADLSAHGPQISALMKRNHAQALGLGMNGTPTYLIGDFRTSTLDYNGFKQAVAEARRRQAVN
ncbi:MULTISPECIES: DsbA family protein [Kaistia]|uniref:DsbA family protein n=1 Tax=Kaistia nematophila TaxID=2994654 RepID=A0A9X3IMF5_9HYPH|nr:DsbA family protein [Kaistia nematophila]MBN9025504.1 DsbA family protein [Hyphomicrobiales bacterium]MCX5569840.1 DsbA family protein [Kaistia nematophila]